LLLDLRGLDFLAVDFLAGTAFARDFLAVDAFAVDFLILVPMEPVFFLSRAGSILTPPALGANKLWCPSFHRTRYRARRSPSITSMISPWRGSWPTFAACTVMRSPFLAKLDLRFLASASASLGTSTGHHRLDALRPPSLVYPLSPL
jgi:hypothetical protein